MKPAARLAILAPALMLAAGVLAGAAARASGEAPVWGRPFAPAEFPALAAELAELQPDLAEALADAGGNGAELAAALDRATPGAERAELAELIVEIAHLDRLEARGEWLLDDVRLARAARVRLGGELPDDVYREGLRSPRLGPYIHLSPWRRALQVEIAGLAGAPPDEVAAAVRARAAAVELADEPTYFGPPQTPEATLATGRGSAMERAALAVALARAAGLPARLTAELTDAELSQPDGSWTSLGLAPAEDGAEVAPAVADSRILVRLAVRGRPAGEQFEPALASWQRGGWTALDPRESAFRSELGEDGAWHLAAPAGRYLLTAGQRDGRGQPYIFARIVELDPAAEPVIEAALDIPLSELAVESRLDRTLPDGLSFELSGSAYPGPLAGRRHVLVVFDPSEEPSRRMLPLVAAVVAEWMAEAGSGERPVPALFVQSGGGEPALDLLPAGLHRALALDPDGAAAAALGLPARDASGASRLPAVLLDGADGRHLLYREGYDLTIDQALREAAALAGP